MFCSCLDYVFLMLQENFFSAFVIAMALAKSGDVAFFVPLVVVLQVVWKLWLLIFGLDRRKPPCYVLLNFLELVLKPYLTFLDQHFFLLLGLLLECQTRAGALEVNLAVLLRQLSLFLLTGFDDFFSELDRVLLLLGKSIVFFSASVLK